MTTTERVKDIEKRSGLSEQVVRAVLRAERESMMDSLKRGERVTLLGRCTVTPFKRGVPVSVDGTLQIKNYLRASARPLPSVLSELKACSDYNREEADVESPESIQELMEKHGITIMQLSALE